MVIYDYDTKAGREYKHRVKFLAEAEREILHDLTDAQQDALLRLEDTGLDFNTRLAAGRQLPAWVLKIAVLGHSSEVKSIPQVALDERS